MQTAGVDDPVIVVLIRPARDGLRKSSLLARDRQHSGDGAEINISEPEPACDLRECVPKNLERVQGAQIEPTAGANGERPEQAVAPPCGGNLGSAGEFLGVEDRALGGKASDRGPKRCER